MATTSALLSIDEYLRSSYHPDADFVDGLIEERNLGEFEHARLQGLIASFFVVREKQWSIRTVVEQRIRVAANRVRICDIALLRADTPREAVAVTPPLLCIEILTPEDRIARAELVLADYGAMGVKNIWLVDPIARTAHIFDATGLHTADPAGLTVADTPILLNLNELFEALN